MGLEAGGIDREKPAFMHLLWQRYDIVAPDRH
jgi:hypothetical protein